MYQFRIGNLVGTYKPHKVNGIYLSHITAVDENGLQQNSHQYNLLPIPITPTILEKLGFEGDDSMNDYRLGEFRVAFHIHDGVVEWAGKRIYEFIPPLHQLQNLYFALTGEELTYTP